MDHLEKESKLQNGLVGLWVFLINQQNPTDLVLDDCSEHFCKHNGKEKPIQDRISPTGQVLANVALLAGKLDLQFIQHNKHIFPFYSKLR